MARPGFNGRIVPAGTALLLSGADSSGPLTYVFEPGIGLVSTIPYLLVATDGDTAYFDAGGDALAAYAIGSGRRLWTRHVPWHPFTETPTVTASSAYVSDNTGPTKTVRAFDLATGELRWTLEAGEVVHGVTPGAHAILVASEDCRVYAVRP